MSTILQYNKFANIPQPEKKAKKAKSFKKTPKGKDRKSDEFLEIKDYPVFPSKNFKERFSDVEVFQEFYLPMLANVVPHPPQQGQEVPWPVDIGSAESYPAPAPLDPTVSGEEVKKSEGSISTKT